MDPARFTKVSDVEWRIEPVDGMRVPAILFADEALLRAMDDKVFEQAVNVAKLPGIVGASYAMPDAHWGYGFPIGGVAAFDPRRGGVISAGGVGFDISCGVRDLLTGLTAQDVEARKVRLADLLYARIPAGVGSTGAIRLSEESMTAMLRGGARWAISRGWGREDDADRIEERGTMRGAIPEAVSEHARRRQRDEMGTLGSGNHYLEVQRVDEIHDAGIAKAFGLVRDQVVVSIHCGSRGLGHQIGTDYLREMALAAPRYGISLPDRELACVPVFSPEGERYLGAMRAAVNCALANRQILTHLVREVFAEVFPGERLPLLYDVSHNTCKVEGSLFVHRKGATRAFGPGHPDLPESLKETGQPVLVGGSMGTASWVLAGVREGRAWCSACHGAGRAMSRHAAYRRWKGRQVVDELSARGIVVRCPSSRGVSEEAPGAYKDVGAVVDAADRARLAKKVARLVPMICVKG